MRNQIYLALDYPDGKQVEQFLQQNELDGVPVKVGMELFYREGRQIIEKLQKNNHPVFLDLKLHDIPTTVERAMENLAKLGVDIVNVHALGGSEMIKRAKEGLLRGGGSNTKLIAVTILTSLNEASMNQELHIKGSLEEQVTKLSAMSKSSGADGVVCSVHEVRQIKQVCGKDFLTITPGIRLKNTNTDDQERIATPAFAKEIGADKLVIGRSITSAKNPKQAYKTALKEMNTIGI